MKRSFLRISWTLKALRIVWSTQDSSASAAGAAAITSQLPPAASIFSFAAALKACARTVSFFEISPLARTLTGWRRLARPASRSDSGRHLVARLEASLQVGDVDRLGPRPELLEGHRHLLVRAAQLAHPHVDRVLAALVGGLALVAGAGAGALVAAARGLAVAGALAAADALARAARAGRPAVQADVAARRSSPQPPLTSTRCSTTRIMPRSCGVSVLGLAADPAELERPQVSPAGTGGTVGRAHLLEGDGSHQGVCLGTQGAAPAPSASPSAYSRGRPRACRCVGRRAPRAPRYPAASRRPPACAGSRGPPSSP